MAYIHNVLFFVWTIGLSDYVGLSGPDFFFIEFFINGGAEIKRKLLDIINQSWEEGVLPMEWRRANVKFLKKLNKTNYNLPSSYRPISLTNVVVKMMQIFMYSSIISS
jgi:hypothetical protein